MAESEKGKNLRAEAIEKRQRKKKLISDVRQQLEFYFSSANLQKDLFMQEILAKCPYVELELFNKFNKIKSLSTDPNIVRKAVETSNMLELSNDKLGIQRKVPTQTKENEMECTIYIEDVPATADHNWIKGIFSQYGRIDYISLPRFKETGNSKGFAFVEFQTEKQANSALSAFGGLTSFGEVKSEDLRSIQTYCKNDADINEQSSKRSLSDDGVSEACQSKKIKSEPKDKSETGKKKKKRKRKTKDKEVESKSIYLKVMPKRQWKNLRNEYLNTMRLNKKLAQDYFISFGGTSFAARNQERKASLSAVDVSKMPVFVANSIVKIEIEDVPQDKKKFKQTISEEHSGVSYIDINPLFKVIHIRFKTSEDASAFMENGDFKNKTLLKDDIEEAYWENIYASWMSGRKKNKKTDNSNVEIGPKLEASHIHGN